MSTRRTESGPRSNASALPPTLFRLPDLTQPAQSSPTASPKVTSSVETSIGNRTDFFESQAATSLSPAQPTAPASATLTPTAPTNQPLQKSSSEFDRPAARSWMDSLGSNKGIAVMIALVLIAAWWTSPNRKEKDIEVRSGQSLAQQTPSSDELNLSVDLGNKTTPTQAANGLASSPSSKTAPPSKSSGFDASAFAPSFNAPVTKADAVVAKAPPNLTSSVANKSNAITSSVNNTVQGKPPTGSVTATPASLDLKPTLSAPVVSAATQPDSKIPAKRLPSEGMPTPSASNDSSLALAAPDLSSFATPASTISTTAPINKPDDLKKMSLETSSNPASATGPVSSTTPGAVDWSRYLLGN